MWEQGIFHATQHVFKLRTIKLPIFGYIALPLLVFGLEAMFDHSSGYRIGAYAVSSALVFLWMLSQRISLDVGVDGCADGVDVIAVRSGSWEPFFLAVLRDPAWGDAEGSGQRGFVFSDHGNPLTLDIAQL